MPAQDIGTFLPVCVLLEIQIFLICKRSYYESSSVFIIVDLREIYAVYRLNAVYEASLLSVNDGCFHNKLNEPLEVPVTALFMIPFS